jgi:hypothetical protein
LELNNIQLQPELIETLYKDHLCKIEARVADPLPQVQRLGQMNKGILWLIEEEQEAFLNETDLLLLQKILHACRLEPDDIALVNRSRTTLSVPQLVDQFRPETVILSGTEIGDDQFAGTDFYEVLQINTLRVLKTDSFDAMGKDQSLKSRFWSTLRILFNL